jgi:hypothetical protein
MTIFGDQPFRANLGMPVVLYPDPEKDPTNDAIVSELWVGLRDALEWADYVLILGHSLHDPALVRSVQAAMSRKKRLDQPFKVAVSFVSDDAPPRIKSLLPNAIHVRLEFGPKLSIKRQALDALRP